MNDLSELLTEELPDTRSALNVRFKVGDYNGCLNIGFYPSGRPGEIFVHYSIGEDRKVLMDLTNWAAKVSEDLQRGKPIDELFVVDQKLTDPEGLVRNFVSNYMRSRLYKQALQPNQQFLSFS